MKQKHIADWLKERPDLMSQWSEKNDSPESYTLSDKVLWKCVRGHEWSANSNGRLHKSRGCPYCAGQIATRETSFSGCFYELAKSWHPTRNGKNTPDNVCASSGKKFWWVCSEGHEFLSSCANRQKHNCPYCSGRLVTNESNLLVLFPNISAEWSDKNLKKPQDFRPYSNVKVWWNCIKCHHNWEATISSRTCNGRGCPSCLTISAMEKHPELHKEWHELKNGPCILDKLVPTSPVRVWWICHICGNEWESTIATRSQGHNCPRCAFTSENHNLTLNHTVMRDWDWSKNKDNPRFIPPDSCKIFWWKCVRGHEWQASASARTRHRGCPFCHGTCSALELRVFAEIKKLFTDAKLRDRTNKVECDVWIPSCKTAIEVDGQFWHKDSQLKDIKKNNHLESLGICIFRLREYPLDKIRDQDVVFFQKTLKDAIGKVILEIDEELGKIYCKQETFINDELFNNLISKGKVTTGLDITHPMLAKEWGEENAPLLASDVSYGSSIQVWWKCKKGHHWKASPNTRSSGRGCPYCAGVKATPDNNIAVVNPDLAQEWSEENKESPFKVTPMSQRIFWWECNKCGKKWEARVQQRVKGYGKCPLCYPQKSIRVQLRSTGKKLLTNHHMYNKISAI